MPEHYADNPGFDGEEPRPDEFGFVEDHPDAVSEFSDHGTDQLQAEIDATGMDPSQVPPSAVEQSEAAMRDITWNFPTERTANPRSERINLDS